MINKWICFLSLFLVTFFASAQVNNLVCNCPNSEIAGTKADSTFHFSNGKAIVLCGYREPDIKPVRFSEFVIAVCGQTQIIDSWGATQTCLAKFQRDTLHISEIKYLPAGKDFKYISVKWSDERVYFRKGKVVKDFL